MGRAGAWNCTVEALILYFCEMNRLTRQEQIALCIILSLLVLGWGVKAYRTAHPKASAAETTKP